MGGQTLGPNSLHETLCSLRPLDPAPAYPNVTPHHFYRLMLLWMLFSGPYQTSSKILFFAQLTRESPLKCPLPRKPWLIPPLVPGLAL